MSQPPAGGPQQNPWTAPASQQASASGYVQEKAAEPSRGNALGVIALIVAVGTILAQISFNLIRMILIDNDSSGMELFTLYYTVIPAIITIVGNLAALTLGLIGLRGSPRGRMFAIAAVAIAGAAILSYAGFTITNMLGGAIVS